MLPLLVGVSKSKSLFKELKSTSILMNGWLVSNYDMVMQ